METLPVGIRNRLEPARAAASGRASFEGFPGRVLELLSAGEALAPDEIARQLGAPIGRVLSALLELELHGAARRDPGPMFRAGRGLSPRG